MLARPQTVVALRLALANRGSGRPVSFQGQGSRPATGQGCLFIWVVLDEEVTFETVEQRKLSVQSLFATSLITLY